MVFASSWGCDRAVDNVPLWPDGVSPGPAPDAGLLPGSDASVYLPNPWPQPRTEASVQLPDPQPLPVKQPPYDLGVMLKTCGDSSTQQDLLTAQQCASGISVVEQNLAGSRTGVSLRLGGPAPKYGPSVHAAYWRCTPTCCPSKSGPMPPCAPLKYATATMASPGYKVEHFAIQGMGPSLRLDSKGLPRVSAAGPVDVHYQVRGSTGWQGTKAGYSYYSPDVRTWLGLDNSGAPRVAWANLTGTVKEVKQAQQTSSGWKVSSTKLPGMYGAWSFAAAHDKAGGLHQAWVRSEQTMAPAKAKIYLEYRRPQKAVEVVLAQPSVSLKVKELYVDQAGKAHILYFQWSGSAPVAQTVYATNAQGKWTNQLLNLTSSCAGQVTPQQAAITSDSQGKAHVALTGTISPGNKGVLLVGNNTKGNWAFRVVDKGATGAVSIAVRYGMAFVGYFGATSFRVARVCD